MALPAGLVPRVELFYSGLWQNITSFVRTDPGIAVSRGRRSEDSEDTPASCNVVVNNGDGRFSPRNPTSPLYGLIGRNTPLRAGLGVPPLGAGTALVTASTSLVAPTVTAEAAAVQLTAWATYPINNITLPGGFTAVGAELDAGSILTVALARRAVGAGATGTATATAAAAGTSYAATNVVVHGGAFVAENSSSNVNGNDSNVTRTCTQDNLVLMTCVWSEDTTGRMMPPKLGASTGSATPPDTGEAPFLVADSGIPATVQTPRIQVWAWWVPATGAITASIAGPHDGFTSTALSLVEFSGASAYYPRFVGEVSEFPVAWEKRGTNAWVELEAGGVSRRLASSNQDSARSAIYESFVRNRNAVAYWPMEDGETATSFGPGLTTHGAMTFAPGAASGNQRPVLAAVDTLPASDPLPTFTQSGGIGVVPTYGIRPNGIVEEVSFGALVHISAAGTAAGANIIRGEFSGGDISSAIVEYNNSATFVVKFEYSDGTASFSSGAVLTPDGGWLDTWFMVYFQMKQNGAAVDGFLSFLAVDPKTNKAQPLTYSQPFSLASKQLGKLRRLLLGVEGGSGNTLHTNAPAFGHGFAANAFNPFGGADPYTPNSAWALTGWNGQKVSDQLHRLGSDNAVPVSVRHNDTDLQIGYQVSDTAYRQLQDAAHSGVGGQLSDAPGYGGFVWKDRIYKENRAPRLTFVYSAGTLTDPLLPVDDDLITANDVTASRRNGGSSRQVKTSGALSVMKPPLGVGRYTTAEEFSLYSDSQTNDVAGWLLNRGTVDETRWPQIGFDLANPTNASKLAAMKYFALGDVVRLTGMPVWVSPGPRATGAVDLIAIGATEYIGFTTWSVVLNCQSTAPFLSAVVEPPGGSSAAILEADRIGDDGLSTLAAGVTSSATSLSVATASPGALWTLVAADWPIRILVAGEEMTVTAIAGASSPQTFTVTRSVNGVVKAQVAGAGVSAPAPIVGL